MSDDDFDELDPDELDPDEWVTNSSPTLDYYTAQIESEFLARRVFSLQATTWEFLASQGVLIPVVMLLGREWLVSVHPDHGTHPLTVTDRAVRLFRHAVNAQTVTTVFPVTAYLAGSDDQAQEVLDAPEDENPNARSGWACYGIDLNTNEEYQSVTFGWRDDSGQDVFWEMPTGDDADAMHDVVRMALTEPPRFLNDDGSSDLFAAMQAASQAPRLGQVTAAATPPSFYGDPGEES